MNDLQDLHELYTDEEVMRYWSTAPHSQLQQTENTLRFMIDGEYNGRCDFIIDYAPPSTTPKLIGKLGVWDGHEIGFMLARSFWGKGHMKEAMTELLRDFWQREDMKAQDEIVADVDPRNGACIGLLKSFGFKETGYREKTWETHLGWCDSLDLKLERPKD
ncbi:MAG: hypothetical protein L6R38_000695 [Xanthoria sp. 2 TBL-2021]|nr:MAG: hypothetical protein L6R38_000695 [Xanthoria sp. 2 TBL-2021]